MTESELQEKNWVDLLDVEIFSKTEISKLIGKSKDFYVYILWRMYEEPPLPFYVGKGHGQRILKHGVKSDKNVNPHKTNVFKKHSNNGLESGYSIISFRADENVALEEEIYLINLIGREDLNQGPLVNKTDGGDGTQGHFALKGADNPASRTVIAQGVEYGCLKDASDFLNINSSTLIVRIRKGWTGYYYKDEGQRIEAKGVVGIYKKAVFVEGQRFNSLSEAGEKTGRDFRQISKRIKNGWPGYYYIEDGQLPRKTTWSDREDKVPVLVRGVSYSTIAEAVKATGESISMVSKRCLSSNFPEYSRKDGKLIEKENPPRYPEEVSIESKRFPSLGKAAESYDMSIGGIANRCRNESNSDWFFTNKEKQKKESFSSQFSSKPVPVEVDGVVFSSQSEAAINNNIDISSVKRRCKSPSFPNWNCESIEKEAPKDGRVSLINIIIDGVSYRSISQASKKLGVHRSVIKRKVDSDEFPNYKKS